MTHPTRAFSGSIINRFTGSKILARVGQISVAFPVIDERKKSIKVLQPDDLMPFGKYRGQTVQSIADKDYSYLLWVKENSEDVVIDFGKLNRK